jgi:hypothetical protein
MDFVRESWLYSRGDLIMSITDTIRFKTRGYANERDRFTTFYRQDHWRATSKQGSFKLLAQQVPIDEC